MVAVILCGLAMLGVTGGAVLLPRGAQWALLAAGGVAGAGAYWLLTEAMRAGEVSVVTPFRYARLLVALVLGAAVLGERPDAPVFAGAALIVGSGLYSLSRERAGALALARAAG